MKAPPRPFNQSKCNTRDANIVPLRRFPRVLGHEPRSKLLAAVAERTVATSHSFRAPDVVNMLWAYARWHRGGSSGSSEVVAALSSNALSSLTAFTPYQCANLAWSLAMLDAPLPVGSRACPIRVAGARSSPPPHHFYVSLSSSCFFFFFTPLVSFRGFILVLFLRYTQTWSC